jgi:hypothetical protein
VRNVQRPTGAHPDLDRRRRPTSTRLLGLTFVALTALAVLTPLTALAQTTPQEIDSFALAPTGTDPTQPGSRPYLSYSLAPGATQADSVTLWNYGTSQLTFHIYAPDAFNNVDGSFALQDGTKPPKDAGAWVKVDPAYVTVPPGTKADIAVSLTVPPDASPGDHTAAIVAASQTPGSNQEGKQVLIDRRTGSRLYVRVNGPANPALTVEDMHTVYQSALNPLDGSLDVTYTVRNSGNIRLGAHQSLDVSDVLGSVASRTSCPALAGVATDTQRAAAKQAQADGCLPDIPELLPGNSVTRHVTFSGVAATFRVTAEVNLKPYAAGGGTGAKLPDLSSTSASQSTWAIPWLLVILLLVLGAVIWIVRRQKGRSPRAGTGPVHGGGGPAGNGGPGAGPNGQVVEPRVPARSA